MVATFPPERPCWPFDGADYRMAMGLLNLDPADWIEIDATYPALMAERRRLLAENRDAVYAALPGSEDAGAELLGMLGDHLPARFPGLFARDGARLANRATGEAWDLAGPAAPPLEVAGRLVPEDLCLMLPGPDGAPVLAAAVLCFPNRWRLAEKIGRAMPAIHGPVALYPDKLQRPVDRFIGALSPERPVWRMNWSLNDDPALFQPVEVAHTDPRGDITAENAGERLFLRIERQTLRRLPATGAVLFTIRTYQRPIGLLAPGEAAQFARILRTVPEEVVRYKGLHRTAPPALAVLDRLAG